MPAPRDLPDWVPLFPLTGAILLPRTVLPLHIFEPRYLQMVEDALRADGRMIAVIQPTDDGLAAVGAAGRIAGFTETDDGRMMISLRCVSRFRLIEAQDGFAPYLRGRVDWSDFTADRHAEDRGDPEFDRELFLSQLRRFMAMRDLATDWEAAREADEEMLINSLSMLLPFSPEEKQALLEAQDRAARRVLLDGLIDFALRRGTDEEIVH